MSISAPHRTLPNGARTIESKNPNQISNIPLSAELRYTINTLRYPLLRTALIGFDEHLTQGDANPLFLRLEKYEENGFVIRSIKYAVQHDYSGVSHRPEANNLITPIDDRDLRVYGEMYHFMGDHLGLVLPLPDNRVRRFMAVANLPIMSALRSEEHTPEQIAV